MEFADGEVARGGKPGSHRLLQYTRRRPFERHALGTRLGSESRSQFRIEFHLDGHGLLPPSNSLPSCNPAVNTDMTCRLSCQITTKDETKYLASLPTARLPIAIVPPQD